jgi:Putative GTPase activating protein for Arf
MEVLSTNPVLLRKVAAELELLRYKSRQPFPPACKQLLYEIAGNTACLDCGSRHRPDWASVTYGCLLCLNCSGQHRSLGVRTSFVRSISLDHDWTQEQVLILLEGGNQQLTSFFDRHHLYQNKKSALTAHRYRTKAAQYYRVNLKQHVSHLLHDPYQGREVSRQRYQPASDKQPPPPTDSPRSSSSSISTDFDDESVDPLAKSVSSASSTAATDCSATDCSCDDVESKSLEESKLRPPSILPPQEIHC